MTTHLSDRYVLEEALSRRGSIVVYRAFDQRLSRPVAVKVAQLSTADDGQRRRFEREAALVAKLDHPGVVPVFDFAVAGELAYMVMPLLEGELLSAFLYRHDVIPRSDLRTLGAQLAEAIAECHRAGIVHADVQPENVMVTQGADGLRARLMDFGFARAVDGEGTAGSNPPPEAESFISPEQRDGRGVTPASDVYMLGAVLDHVLQRVESKAEGPDPGLVALAELVQHCMAWAPEARPTAEGVGVALRRAAEQRDDLRDTLAVGSRRLIAGDYEAARRLFDDAALAATSLPAEQRAHVALAQARVAYHQGRLESAMAACRQAMEWLGPDEAPATQSLLASWVALIAVSAGDLGRAEDWLGRSEHFLAGGPDIGPLHRLAVALHHRAHGNLAVAQGRAAAAINHYEASLSSCRPDEHPWEHSIAIYNVGEAYVRAGRFDEAESLLADAFAVKATIGDRWGMAYAYHARAQILRQRGDADRARLDAEAGLMIAEAIGDPKSASALRTELAWLALDSHDLDRAEHLLARALKGAESCFAVLTQLEVRLARAELARLRGMPGVAEDEAEAALKLADRAGADHGRAKAKLVLARARHERGDATGARSSLDAAEDALERAPHPILAIEARALRARVDDDPPDSMRKLVEQAFALGARHLARRIRM